jgi:glycosyltransferase involved in cell wall biosynthesis
MSRRGEPRVLFCTDTYPPQVNGVSVVTALSVEGLAARGWRCAVIAPKYPPGAFDAFGIAGSDDGAPHERLALPSLPFPPYPDIRLAAPMYGAVSRAIRRFQPDLVHCETEFVVGRLGQIASRRRDIPLVSSYHTDFSRYTVAYGMPWLRDAVSSYIGRFHRRSRRAYTPSEPAREDLMRLGVPDVEVWGRGVDIDHFHPSRRSAPLRTALGLDGKFAFVYVGRLAPEKSVDTILRAFRLARELVPGDMLRLVIAGTGPSNEALVASAPEGVNFLGHVDRRRRLPILYASADAFVFASLTETLGLVVLEAMASGLPVVAAPAGGVADHLSDGTNGLAYPAGDAEAMAHALVRLAMEPQLRARLARAARLTASRRSWAAELDRLDRSYREVCEAEVSERPARSSAAVPAPGHSL